MSFIQILTITRFETCHSTITRSQPLPPAQLHSIFLHTANPAIEATEVIPAKMATVMAQCCVDQPDRREAYMYSRTELQQRVE
jgi:hypothetical protein